MPRSPLPQADDLARVRRVVEIVSRRPRIAVRAIGAQVGLSDRHAAYYAGAAEVLGLIRRDGAGFVVTDEGLAVVGTPARSLEEEALLRRRIEESPPIRAVAPDLFAGSAPSLDALTRRIARKGLSLSTARRRAETLLRWRRQVAAPLFSASDELSSTATMNRRSTASKKTEPAHAQGPSAVLTGLSLHRFKGFADAHVDLGRFTVVVGTNASGKSNLRDALRFLHGLARGYTLAETIGEKWIEGGVLQWRGIRGGTREVTYRGAPSFALEAHLRLRDGQVQRTASYLVEVAVPTNGPPRVVAERLVVEGRGQFVYDSHPGNNPPKQEDDLHLAVRLKKAAKKGYVGRTVSVIANKPALTQLADHREVQPKEVRDLAELVLGALRSMRFLDLDADQMRLPSIPGQLVLGDKGENLSSVLQAICAEERRKRALIQWVRELTPLDVVDFDFVPDQTGRVLLTLVETGGRRTSAYSASDGTLRFLAMIAAFLGPDPASFYFFEELETGLHPSRLHLLLGLIESQTARGHTQVVATTHSPQLLAFLRPETIEHVAFAYRLPGHDDQRLKKLVDIPDARRVLEKQDVAVLHATGWLESAADFTEPEA